MSETLNNTENRPTKGQRLKWPPMRKVAPVKLSSALTKGRKINSKTLLKRAAHSHAGNFKPALVP